MTSNRGDDRLSAMLATGISRRQVLRSGAIAAAGLSSMGLLAACGSDDDSSSSGSGSSTTGSGSAELSFVYMGTAEQQKSWNDLFAEFGRTSRDITLKATGVPVDNWAAFFDKVNTQIAGGVKYDIVQIATEGRELFAAANLLEPLDAFIGRDRRELDELLADVDPNLIKWNTESGSPDGRTYYLPGDFNTMCLWLNTDVVKRAGADIPTDEWTWDDFYALGRQVKDRTGAFLYPATAEYFIGVMPWLTTNGASTMSADWKSATCDTPEAIEAAEFARKLVQDRLSPAPGGSFDRFTLTIQGRMAAFGGGRWPILQVRSLRAVDKFELFAWPHNKARRGSPVGWAGYPIFKTSENKDAAWTFVKFLVSEQGETYFARGGGTIVPARRSVAESPAFLDNSPRGSEKLYEALSYATPIPSPPRNNIIQREIEDIWGQILTGNTSAEDGMKKMQDEITANL